MRILILLVITWVSTAQEPIPVTVKPFKDVLIERQLKANAEVKALNNSQLSAELTALVNTIHVDVGDPVTQGQLLLELDPTDAQLQLEQAKTNTQATQARLNQAELRLKRANELNQSQYISADDLLARETDVAVLRADLMRLKVAEKTARRQIAKTKINAPFAGVVTARYAQQGQLLMPGATVMDLVETSNKQIHAKIPSHLANQLASADRIVFSQNGIETAVELLQLSAVVDQQAAIQSARFKPLSDGILVGQTGQLVWYLKDQLLSADLVVKRAGKLGIFIADNGTAKHMPLSQAQEGRPVPIATTKDWQVIIGGRERLQDGQAITVK